MDAPAFENLRDWLRAWYSRGDRAAADRFARTWLLPRVNQLCGRLRQLKDERDDCAQFVAERFLDRAKAVGAVADGFAYWDKKLRWLSLEYLRRHDRLPVPVSDPVERVRSAGSGATEDRVIAEITAKAIDLAPALAALGPAQRVYLLVYFHHILGALLDASDRAWIAEQSVVSVPEVERRLADLKIPPQIDALLTLLFDPSRLETARVQCLDAFRKGRKRAVLRLLRALAPEGAV